MTSFSKTQHPVSDFLTRTRLAPRQAYKALTVWPLQLRESDAATEAPGYVALGTALAKGTLEISEVDAGGQVPHVRASNRGREAVLFVFGEEIRGAKQNRIANASFLVPPRSTTVLDVSCVEAGRWAPRSAHFEDAQSVISQDLRRKVSKDVAASRKQGLRFVSDQGKVWNEIGLRIMGSGAPSSTQAYADYAESRSSDLRDVAAAFEPIEGQVGFVACIGDRVAGIEAIGRPDVFRADFQALLRSYAIDAIDAGLVSQLERKGRSGVQYDGPESFLEALSSVPFESGPSLGLGEDLRLGGNGLGGCALVHGDLVHLTAFPA